MHSWLARLRKGACCGLAAVMWLQAAGGTAMAQSQLADPYKLNIPDAGPADIGYHGSFSQRIDFKLPAWRGQEPRLGLSYDSGRVNATGAADLVGAGWRLTGLSSIDRASERRAVPRFNAKDIWLLDGQELVPCGTYKGAGCQDEAGGTHATWVENFQRIRKLGNNTWDVTSRDGTRFVYKPLGTWAGTATVPLSGDQKTQMLTQYRYLLAEKVDTLGNKVAYSYACGADLDCRVSRISYGHAEIRLHWEARADVVTYAAGHMLGKSATRLRTVEVRADNKMLRTYELSYKRSPATGRSLLTSLRERGRDSAIGTGGAVTAGTSLPPYTFQYTDAAAKPRRVADGYSVNQQITGVMAFSRGRFQNSRSLGSIKLTSKTEKEYETGDWVDYHYCVITKSGEGEIAKFRVQNDRRQSGCGAENFRFVSLKTGHNTLARSVSWSYVFFRCVGSECNSYQEREVRGNFGRPTYISDFDGDGLDDTIEVKNNRLAAVRFSKGATSWGGVRTNDHFGTPDLNGDGMSDMLYTEATGGSSDLILKLSNGVNGFESVYRANTPHRYDQYIFTADLNGDGTADIIRPTGGDQYRVYYVTGNRFVQGPVIRLPGTCVGAPNCSQPFATDVNGDGRADMVAPGVHKQKKARIFINMGDRFDFIPRAEGAGETLAGTFAGFTGDGDVDGIQEFALRTDGEDHGHGGQRWTMTAEKPDLLTFVKTPLGAESKATYGYHEPKVQVDLPMNLFVVKSLETYDGRSVRAKTDYTYSGARYDWTERQFLGFEKIKATLPKIDGESGRPTIETTYRQDLAAIGRIKEIQRKDGAGKLLQRVQQSYQILGTAKPYRAFNTATTTTTYFGATARVSREQRIYDTHGLVRGRVQHGDLDKTGDEWRLSRWPYPNYPKYIVDRWAVESINAGTTYHYTENRYWRRWHYYDGANTAVTKAPEKGLKTQTSEWTGGTAENKIAQSISTYDGKGNLVTEADALGNTTRYVYDSAYSLFPVEVRNPLYSSDSRQKKLLNWDKTCGVVTKETDANGAVTSHIYDALCRRTRTDLPGGGQIKYAFLNWGNPKASYNRTRTQHPNGAGEIYSETQFDGFGRTYEERSGGAGGVNGAGQRVHQGYDARGNVRVKSLPFVSGDTQKWTQYRYDGLDRPIRVNHPDGKSVTTSYLAGDKFNAVQTVDEGGHKQASHFDAFGNEIFRDRFDGETRMRTAYRYDVLNRLVEITDPRGAKWAYAYDGHGNRLAERDPDLGCREMVYDKANRLSVQLTAKGTRTGYLYDGLGRVTRKTVDKDALQFSDCFAINDGPRANNDYGYGTHSIKSLAISASSLLANDTDPDKDTLTIFSVQGARNGSVALSSDKKTVTFTPNKTFIGLTTFGYTVWDGELKSSATVEVMVARPPSSAGSKTFTANGNFTVPYYKQITIEVSGAGGGSGKNSYWYGNDDNGDWRKGAPGGDAGGSKFLTIVGGGGRGGAGGYRACNGMVCRADSGSNAGASGGNVSNVTGGGASGADGPTTSQRGGQLGGHGGRGGKATSKWTLGQSGAPTVGQVIPVTVGAAGTGYRNGGGGAVKITWTAQTKPTAGPDRGSVGAGKSVVLNVLSNDSDPNGDALTITRINNVNVFAGSKVEVAGGEVKVNADKTLTYSPLTSTSGLKSFTYTVSDGTETANGTVKIEVKENVAPYVARPIPDQTIQEDTNWVYKLPANIFADPDGHALSLSVSSSGGALPAWLSFNASAAEFSGKPPLNFVGKVPVTVKASDGQASASDTFEIDIVNVNDDPVLEQPIANQSIAEDTAWAFTVPTGTFSDADGDVLTLSALLSDGSDLPAWLGFDPATNAFAGTPPQDFNGIVTFLVRASDGQADVVTTFDLTVQAVNDGPAVANGIPDQEFNEDTAWDFTIPAEAFADAEGDTLTYSATLAGGAALPGWIALDGTTGRFTGTPPANFFGVYDVVIVASDGQVTASDTIRVTVKAVNDLPVASAAIANKAFNEDGNWAYTIPAEWFTDPDGDTLTYSARLSNNKALPSWVKFNAASRTFTAKPPANYNGHVDLKLTVADGTGSTSDVFRLTVRPVNDPPVARDNGGYSTTVIKNLTISKNALLANDTDVEGKSLKLTAVKNAVGGSVSISGNNVVYKPSLTFKGKGSFQYVVSDGKLTDTAKVTVNVTVPAVKAGSKTFRGNASFKIPFYNEITIEVAGGGGGDGQNSSYRCGRDDCYWTSAGANGRNGGTSKYGSLIGHGGRGGASGSSRGCGSRGGHGSAAGGNKSNVTGGGGGGGRGGGCSSQWHGGGPGGNGGKATSTWKRGRSGAPRIGSTISFSVGGGGGGVNSNGGGGWVKISWK